ncbi:type III pantothenate kinase [Actinobacteria bacterium YIM 96077]|uniref:Type III pantothenate kinase n=1 Tax=Phytoactinopolyspora halophila TaxID=1981511 RepID=A0A329R1G3_9ACTN|nr:type III pantothenate kinase [Phytoactinopolyspora halophila]AYY11481.1 type III pantothenate kinase [Actinobacteria bacterium YIM 96077]RAW18036.1 type III pantothenate kinase [Phytoactinopolyspora halophila]
MLLAIEAGNTDTVIGLIDDREVVHHWRVSTVPKRTADEFMALLRGLMAGAEDTVHGVVVCSTVPSVRRTMRALVARYYADLPSVMVEPGVRTGIPVMTDNPREVGTDRVLNALAAAHFYGTPCLVVSFATATTFDVVSSRGEYVGGAIAPGIGVSLEALGQAGAQLRQVELSRPRSVIAKNTVEAVQSGTLYGFSSLADGIIARMASELGVPTEELPVIATGGLAPSVLDEMSTVKHHDPWLTLLGLSLAYERNVLAT